MIGLDRMPVAPVAVAFAAGIALAPWARGALAWAVWLTAIGASMCLLALARPASAIAPLLLAVLALGAVRAAPTPLGPDHVASLPLPRVARIEGRVAAEPIRWAPDRTRLSIDVETLDGQPRRGRVQLTVYGAPPPLAEGYRLAGDVGLHRATGFHNPGGFDYAAYLAREGIHVVGSVRADRLTIIDDPLPPWPVRVKRGAVAAIERALPPVSAALLGGLLLGDRSSLPPPIDDAFRRAGVYHVLAVSGFNVALLASAVWGLLTLARLGRRLTACVAMVVVVGFALVVGFQPSVLRAVVMAVLVLGAILLERDASVRNSLALAAVVILAMRPGDLVDPGFQLSFAATAGIVAAPLPRGALAGALGVSLAAQLAVLPVSLSHFNQVSVIGVLANLVVVPLAGLATILGLLAVGLAFVSEGAAAPFFDGVWPALVALRAAVALAASVPGAVVHLPAPHWSAVVAYVAALALGLAWWRRRPERARALGAAALVLTLGAALIEAWPMIRPPDGRLRVAVLDVGQGDAIVVEAPDGQVLLIDAGPGGPMRLDTGERVVAPFLWNRGVRRLAAAVVTHGDLDHAGGMAAIARLFPVGEWWRREAFATAPRSLGGVLVSRLPAPPRPGRPAARNDEAIVLRLDYGIASFLLTSDIGAATERALLGARIPLAATVLKVAHHGSATSSTPAFLRAVQPLVAVVSVGGRNPYGHPDAATIARLDAAGATTLRTDRDGAVLFETDGHTLTVAPTVGRRRDRYCLDPETIC